MAIVLPQWFQHNFVNVENLMIDIFTKVLPDVESGCWTPDGWLDEQLPNEVDPMLWFVRLPGGFVDWDRHRDQSLVQVSAVTGSRDDSWDVMSVVRSVLLPMQGFKFTMADGFTAQIHCAGEKSGPNLLTPGQQLDTRVVTAVFDVGVGLRYRNNYLKEVALL